MESNTDLLFFKLTAWTTDVITIIIVLLFLYKFNKLPVKTYSTYMVLILNISDCIFPVVDIITQYLPQDDEVAMPLGALKTFCSHFSLAFSAAIAVYFYLVLHSNRILNPKRFTIYALVCCFLFSSFFAICVATQLWNIHAKFDEAGLISVDYGLTSAQNQTLYLIFEDLMGTLLPILITLYCYYRVFETLSSMTGSIINPTRVLYYSIIQMVCFMPGIIADLVFIFQQSRYNVVCAIVVGFLHRCWGFLNLLAYWFTNPQQEAQEVKETPEVRKSSTSSRASSRSDTSTMMTILISSV